MKQKNFKKLKPKDKVVVKSDTTGRILVGSVIEFSQFEPVFGNGVFKYNGRLYVMYESEVRKIKKGDKVKLDGELERVCGCCCKRKCCKL